METTVQGPTEKFQLPVVLTAFSFQQYDLYREELKKDPKKFIDENYMYNVLQLQQTPGWEQYYIYP